MKPGFNLRDRSSSRRVFRFVLIAVLLGFGANAVLSIFIDQAQFLHALRNVRVIYFVIPFLLYVLSQVVDSLRLMFVASQFKIRLSFVQAFYNSSVGTFFNSITPLTAGGQPFQIYHLSSVGVPVATSTNLIVSRFVEQAMTTLCISLAFLTQVSWIASSLGMASRFIFVALGISLCTTMLLLAIIVLLLFRPGVVTRLAIRLEQTSVGRLLAKASGSHDWAPKLHRWFHRLRESVRMLWREKTWVVMLDVLLGIANIVLHAYALQFVLEGVVGVKVSFWALFLVYVILWQVVFYIPTPGASGSVEGAFSIVYAGMTGALGPTVLAIFVWRFSTFYLLLVLDGLVYLALGRTMSSDSRRVMRSG
jgi:uncharacterized protein (TIRG00374 family)